MTKANRNEVNGVSEAHSPTPWIAVKIPGGKAWAIDDERTNEHVATAWGTEHDAEANAAFIVQACNAHEALVKIAKAYSNLLRSSASTEGTVATFLHIEETLKLAGENGESI